MALATPKIVSATLSYQRGTESVAIAVGTPAWFAWLARERLFAIADGPRTLTVRKEQRRNGWYWYVYAKRDRKLHRRYLGRSCDLTVERLESAWAVLCPAETTAHPEKNLAHLRLQSNSGTGNGRLDISAVRHYLSGTIAPDSQQLGCRHHQQLAELAALLLSVIEEERHTAAITEEQLRREVADAQRHRRNSQSDSLWGQSASGEVY